MANMHDCAKYAHCSWRRDVGSCPDWCMQFKHRNERVVVPCTECRYADGCSRNTMYQFEKGRIDGIKFYEYHPLEFCSRGESKEE